MKLARSRTPKLLLGLLLALALVAGACGGGSSSKTASKKKVSTADSTTTTAAPLETTTSLADVTTTTAAPKSGAATKAPTIAPKAAPKAAPKQSAGIINVTATPTTAPPVQAKRGGNMTFVALADSPNGFDTTQVQGGAHARAIYDSLLDVDIDNGDIIPRIAESMTSTDGKTWLLKIRPNVKFSDGTPLDAAAVKFNWGRIGDPQYKSPSLALVAQMESFDVVDPLTLRIVSKAVNGQLPRTIVGISKIGSPTAIQQKGTNFGNDPVGAGPFIFKSWKRDDRMELDRNPTYWDQPKPYLDHLTIQVVTDVQQRLNSVKSGNAQLGVVQDPEAFDQATKDSNLKTALTVSALGGRIWVLNLTKAPFNDIRARRAIAYALNRPGFIKTVTKDLDDATDNFIRPPSPFYDAATKMLPYDHAKAQALLDELAAEGKPVSFTLKPSATNAAMGEYFQAQLQEFKNLEVKLEVIPSSALLTTFVTGNFQAVVSQFFNPDPDTFYNNLYSTGSQNWGKYNSKAMDAALDLGRSALDVQTRFGAYKKVQELVRDDVPGVFISQNKAGLVGAKYVMGMKGWEAAGIPAPNWEDIWYDK